MTTSWIRAAALMGFLGVSLGAFGAHGLEEILSEGERAAWWSTAVDYHMWHALALLAVGLVQERTGRGRGAGWCLLAGILVFSGTLYAMGLGGPRWLGAITPLGGTLLLAGWVLLGLAARPTEQAPRA